MLYVQNVSRYFWLLLLLYRLENSVLTLLILLSQSVLSYLECIQNNDVQFSIYRNYCIAAHK